MQDTVTLTGYLGKDPEIRDTQEKTVTLTERPALIVFEYDGKTVLDREDDLMEQPAEYDVTYPSREYGVLSLATHRWDGKRRITSWHRVIVWNVERMEHRGVRIARKGSKVEITGRKTTFNTSDGRSLEQIELIRLRILELK